MLQGYPNLEYIVIDGGSTDGSVDILKKYDEHIDYWVSEPDNGQSHAINKGLLQATGDWITWLHSDDLLLLGALQTVAEVMSGDKPVDWTVGSVVVTDVDKNQLRVFEPVCNTDSWLDFLCTKRARGTSLPQPSSFWSRKAMSQVGMLDETLNYAMDFEYWVRLARCGYRPSLIPVDLALFRLTGTSKTGSGMAEFIREEKLVVGRYMKGQGARSMLELLLYKTFLRELRWYRIVKSKVLNSLYKFMKYVKQDHHTE